MESVCEPRAADVLEITRKFVLKVAGALRVNEYRVFVISADEMELKDWPPVLYEATKSTGKDGTILESSIETIEQDIAALIRTMVEEVEHDSVDPESGEPYIINN